MDGKEQVDKQDKTDQQSSIKMSRNAKGDYAYEVKVYDDTPTDCEAKLRRYLGIAEGAVAEAIVREGRA